MMRDRPMESIPSPCVARGARIHTLPTVCILTTSTLYFGKVQGPVGPRIAFLTRPPRSHAPPMYPSSCRKRCGHPPPGGKLFNRYQTSFVLLRRTAPTERSCRPLRRGIRAARRATTWRAVLLRPTTVAGGHRPSVPVAEQPQQRRHCSHVPMAARGELGARACAEEEESGVAARSRGV